MLTEEKNGKRELCACVFSQSVVSDSVTPWTIAHQAPLSMGFPRQEYWSGLRSLLQGIFLTQKSSLHLLHCGEILYHLNYQRSLELCK